MNLSLRPEIERYIEHQVESGDFPTPEAVVEAAIAQWQESDVEELDDETIAAINEAEAQCDRGEGIDFKLVREQWKQRLHPEQ
jgi:Arc/MetJ-type ribon-helix-helix transcriptional regulator